MQEDVVERSRLLSRWGKHTFTDVSIIVAEMLTQFRTDTVKVFGGANGDNGV